MHFALAQCIVPIWFVIWFAVVATTNNSITIKSNIKNKLGKVTISAYISSTLVATKEIEIVSMFIKAGEE